MIKKSVLILFLLIASVTASLAAGKFTLVVDAGHGGHDVGAKGAVSLEKNINLNVALAFGKYVEQNCKDVNVIYTRKTDEFIPLKTRANIANRNNADLFISVHTNALPNGRIARGLEVYTLGMHRAKDNLDVAMRENSVIEEEDNYKQTYQGFDPTSSESYIMFEFMQSANMRRSVELAKLIENSACNSAGRNNMGVHQAGFLVLRETSMPSCLIELGFITTPDEEEFLNTDDGVDKLAYGIYKAFVEYKKKYFDDVKTAQNNVAPSNTKKEEDEKPENKPVERKKRKKNADKETAAKVVTPSMKTNAVLSDDEPAPVATVKKEEKPVATVQPVQKKQEQVAVKTPAKVTTTVAKKTTATKPTTTKVEKKSVKVVPAKTVVPAKKQSVVKNNVRQTAGKTTLDATKPIFKVQIFAVSATLSYDDPRFKGHKDVGSYKDAGSSLTKYTIGASNDYNEILALRNSLRADFPQAYVIATKDGKTMNLSKAIAEYRKNKKTKK